MSLYKNKKIKQNQFLIEFEKEIQKIARRGIPNFFVYIPEDEYFNVENYCNKFGYGIEVSHETDGKICYKVSI